MYMNGVRTGMETTAAVHRPIRRDLHLALAAFSAVAAGTSPMGTALCRLVATIVRVSVATMAVSASSAFLSINTEIRKLS